MIGFAEHDDRVPKPYAVNKNCPTAVLAGTSWLAHPGWLAQPASVRRVPAQSLPVPAQRLCRPGCLNPMPKPYA